MKMESWLQGGTVMKKIFVYEEDGIDHLETWHVYITNLDNPPPKINKNFIKENFTYIASFPCSPFDCDFDSLFYEKRDDDTYEITE